MFIPLHDANPLRHIGRQYVTYGLIAVTVLIYVFVQSGTAEPNDLVDTIRYSLIPTTFHEVEFRPDPYLAVPEELTLITYAFFHGSIWHLGGNMLFLWVFGDNVEDALGHFRFLIFYLLCAVGAGLAHTLVLASSDEPLIGASGAVAGVVAAYLVLHPRVKIWILFLSRIPLRLSAMWVLGFWILTQIVSLAIAADDQVAWWAHLGGIATGAVLVLVLRRPGVPLFDRGLTPA